MEGTSEEWEIQTYSPPGGSNGKESGMLEKGLRVGKKIVVTGIVISSAPLVLPPLMVFSAFGLAVSVPFGLYFVSYACTEGIMSKFFPMPKPPSHAPLMLGYGEEFPEEDGTVSKEEGFGGGIDMEEEEKEYIYDTEESVEMRIELPHDIEKSEILEDDSVSGNIDFAELTKEGGDDEDLVGENGRPQKEDNRNEERQEVFDTREEKEPLEEGSWNERSTEDVTDVLVSSQDGKESDKNVDEEPSKPKGVEFHVNAPKVGYVDEYEGLKRETRDLIEKIRDQAQLDNTRKNDKIKVQEAPEDAETRDERTTDASVAEIKRPIRDEVPSTLVEDKHAEKKEDIVSSMAVQSAPKPLGEIKRSIRDEVLSTLVEDKPVEKKEDITSSIAIQSAPKPLGEVKRPIRDEVPSSLREDKPVEKKEEIASSIAAQSAPKPTGETKRPKSDEVQSTLVEDKPVEKKEDITSPIAIQSAPKPLGEIKRPIRDEVPSTLVEDKPVKKEDITSYVAVQSAPKPLGEVKSPIRDDLPSPLGEDKPVAKREETASSIAVRSAPKPLGETKRQISDEILMEDKPGEKKEDVPSSLAIQSAEKPLGDINEIPERNRDDKQVVKEVPTEKKRETTPVSDNSKHKKKPKAGKKATSEDDAKHSLGHDMCNDIHSSKKNEAAMSSNVDERRTTSGRKPALSGGRAVAGEQHPHRNGTSKDKQPPSALIGDKKAATVAHPVKAAPSSAHNRVKPSNKALFSEEQIWQHIHALRTIVGYKATPQRTCIEELKALYIFTGVEPPLSFKISSDLAEVNDKLQFLMAIVGVK